MDKYTAIQDKLLARFDKYKFDFALISDSLSSSDEYDVIRQFFNTLKSHFIFLKKFTLLAIIEK